MLPHLKKELLELTKELIRIPSTHSRPQEIDRCASFIRQWLANHEIEYQHVDIKGTPSLTVLPKAGAAPILLLCHFDVVEVDDDALFEPVEKGGNLYGRGAIDDKYAIALALILFREQLKNLKSKGFSQAKMPFGLLLTGDEEVGGYNGAGHFCKKISTEFFIAIDGGDPERIITKEKGILRLELKASGLSAHSARPWFGQSAFDILVDDYQKLQQLFSKQTADHWHRTMVLTNCLAGNGATNIVPGQAVATLDIRYTDKENLEELITAIKEMVTSSVAVTTKAPVFCGGGPSPYLDLLLQHTTGTKTAFEHGASDARFFSELNIPGIVWGADGEMSQHTGREHLVIDSQRRIYDCLDNFFTDLATEGKDNG